MNKKEERLAIIEMNISFLLLFLSPFHFVGGGFFCAIMFLKVYFGKLSLYNEF